jgi:hypothetical protein
MSAYLSDDEEIIYTNDDLELQDLESKLTDEELLELQLAEEEYKRQEAISIEEDRLLSIRKGSNLSFTQTPTKKEENKKKEKVQKKKGMTLEELNKKIEDNAPKKFVSQRVLEKNPELIHHANQNQKEVYQTNLRRFNPRLPPYFKRTL